MDYSGHTRANLMEIIEKQQEEIDSAPTIPTKVNVPEANALADCIRAIDGMQNQSKSSSYSSGFASNIMYNGDYPRQQTDIERILRSLAAKYSIPLVEIRTEPCHRQHVDQINPQAVLGALQNTPRLGGV